MKLPFAISTVLIPCPGNTGLPLINITPRVGVDWIINCAKLFGGLSLGSVKPKLESANTWVPLAGIEIVLFAPCGASFTGVTLNVIVLGVGSRSLLPAAVPPSSLT